MNLFDNLPIGGDKRVNNWPLMENIFSTVMIGVIYVLAIVLGSTCMKNRKPFELYSFMIIYNFIQAIICASMTFGAMHEWIRFKYNFFCQPVDYSYRKNAMLVCFGAWLYYILKIVDLTDTIVFVLRKKQSQITFLHVYHHLTMIFAAWYVAKYVPSGHSLFIGIINSFIHTVMYTYYGLSACGCHIQKYLWWKRYLTQLQIIQFIAVIIHSTINLLTPCDFPKIFDIGYLLYGLFMTVLFSSFYLQTYAKKEKHQKQL